MLFFSNMPAAEPGVAHRRGQGREEMHSDGTEENKQDDQQRSRVEAAGAKDLNPRMRLARTNRVSERPRWKCCIPDCKLGRLL